MRQKCVITKHPQTLSIRLLSTYCTNDHISTRLAVIKVSIKGTICVLLSFYIHRKVMQSADSITSLQINLKRGNSPTTLHAAIFFVIIWVSGLEKFSLSKKPSEFFVCAYFLPVIGHVPSDFRKKNVHAPIRRNNTNTVGASLSRVPSFQLEGFGKKTQHGFRKFQSSLVHTR